MRGIRLNRANNKIPMYLLAATKMSLAFRMRRWRTDPGPQMTWTLNTRTDRALARFTVSPGHPIRQEPGLLSPESQIL